MFCIAKLEGRCLIDRYLARTSGWVRLIACMHLKRVEIVIRLIGHKLLPLDVREVFHIWRDSKREQRLKSFSSVKKGKFFQSIS